MQGHIGYLADSSRPENRPLWQTPRETLEYGEGDCEDQAFLLASMLLAKGYGENDVFVAFGKVNVGQSWEGHAWVEFRDGGTWRLLEPTMQKGPDFWIFDIGGEADPSKYDTSTWTSYNDDSVKPDVWRDGKGDGEYVPPLGWD